MDLDALADVRDIESRDRAQLADALGVKGE